VWGWSLSDKPQALRWGQRWEEEEVQWWGQEQEQEYNKCTWVDAQELRWGKRWEQEKVKSWGQE
jgi:hypothetical protein